MLNIVTFLFIAYYIFLVKLQEGILSFPTTTFQNVFIWYAIFCCLAGRSWPLAIGFVNRCVYTCRHGLVFKPSGYSISFSLLAGFSISYYKSCLILMSECISSFYIFHNAVHNTSFFTKNSNQPDFVYLVAMGDFSLVFEVNL